MNTNNKIILQFFSLLRAGLCKKPADSGLFVSCTLADWESLYILAEQQTVLGVAWDGILTLPTELHPQKPLFYKWLQGALMLEKLNTKMNAVLQDMTALMSVALLKGQGTAALYPNPLHRASGDVDIFPGKAYGWLEDMLPSWGFQRIGSSTKHAEYTYKGVMVENHRYVALFFTPWLAWRLKGIVAEWFPTELTLRKVGEGEVSVPPAWFEALFGVIHFRTHLHLEGVGLRQLCDWWVIMQQPALQGVASQRVRYERGLRRLGLVRMAAVMEELCICLFEGDARTQDLSPMAKSVFEEIWSGGNFGHHAKDAHDHTFASSGGFFKVLLSLIRHDLSRSRRFFSLFPAEAIFSPIFRIAGYVRRGGR